MVHLVEFKVDKQNEAIKRMKEHDQKFHEGKSFIFTILTGENAGMAYWGYGPYQYEEMDNMKLPEGHDADNNELHKNYFETIHNSNLEKVNNELSHNIEGNKYGNIRSNSYYKIKFGKENRFIELYKMFKKAWEAKPTNNVLFITKVFPNKDGYNYTLHSEADNWVDFGNENPNFKAQFEKIHGTGSLEKAMAELNEIILSYYVEGMISN